MGERNLVTTMCLLLGSDKTKGVLTPLHFQNSNQPCLLCTGESVELDCSPGATSEKLLWHIVGMWLSSLGVRFSLFLPLPSLPLASPVVFHPTMAFFLQIFILSQQVKTLVLSLLTKAEEQVP